MAELPFSYFLQKSDSVRVRESVKAHSLLFCQKRMSSGEGVCQGTFFALLQKKDAFGGERVP